MLIGQAMPWEPTYNREIKDANNAVVQYTTANIGVICAAVNAHVRMVGALESVLDWLRQPADTRTLSDTAMAALVETAVGRIGLETLASNIENEIAPSAALDRAVAVEIKAPEAQYTSSIDTAMTIIPSGGMWKVDTKTPSFIGSEALDAAPVHPSNTVMVYIVTVTVAGRQTSGTHVTLPMAMIAAALRARG